LEDFSSKEEKFEQWRYKTNGLYFNKLKDFIFKHRNRKYIGKI